MASARRGERPAGRAQAAQQYLNASLADEGQLHLPPMLPGGGERLFDPDEDLHAWYWSRRSRPPNVSHLKFAREWERRQ